MRALICALALTITSLQTTAFLQPCGSCSHSIQSTRNVQYNKDFPLNLSVDDNDSKEIKLDDKVEDIEKPVSKMNIDSPKPKEVVAEKKSKNSAIEDYIASLNLFNYITVVNDEASSTTKDKTSPKGETPKPVFKVPEEKKAPEAKVLEQPTEIKAANVTSPIDLKTVANKTETVSIPKEEIKARVEKEKVVEEKKVTEIEEKSQEVYERPKVGKAKTSTTANKEKVKVSEKKITEPKVKVEEPKVKVEEPKVKVEEPKVKVEEPIIKPKIEVKQKDIPKPKVVAPEKIEKEEKAEKPKFKVKEDNMEMVGEMKVIDITDQLTEFFKNKGPSAVRDPNTDPSAKKKEFTDYSGKDLNPMNKGEVDKLVEKQGGVLNEVFFKEQFRKLEEKVKKAGKVEEEKVLPKKVEEKKDITPSSPFSFFSNILPSKEEKVKTEEKAEILEKPIAKKVPGTVSETKAEPIKLNIFSNMFNPPIYDNDEVEEKVIPPKIEEKKIVPTISKEETESKKTISNPFSGLFKKAVPVTKVEEKKVEPVAVKPIKTEKAEPLNIKNPFAKILSKNILEEKKDEKVAEKISPPVMTSKVEEKETNKISNPFAGIFSKPFINEEKPKIVKKEIVEKVAPKIISPPVAQKEEKTNFLSNIFSKTEKVEKEKKVEVSVPPPIKAVVPPKKDISKPVFGMFSKSKPVEKIEKKIIEKIAPPKVAEPIITKKPVEANKPVTNIFSKVLAPKENIKTAPPNKVVAAVKVAEEKQKPIKKSSSFFDSLFKATSSPKLPAKEKNVSSVSTQKKIIKQVPKPVVPVQRKVEAPSKSANRTPKKMDDAFIRKVRTLLKGDNNKIKQFQTLTDKFRGSLISSDAYYTGVENLFGESNVENIIQPLLKNLPEQDKRKDLEATIKKAKTPVKSKIQEKKSFFSSFGSSPKKVETSPPPKAKIVAPPVVKSVQKVVPTAPTKSVASSSVVGTKLSPSKEQLLNNRTELFKKGGINAKNYFDSVVDIVGKGNVKQIDRFINEIISGLPKAKADQLKMVRDGNRK